MKKAEMIDLFERLVRSHALMEGTSGHIPQSQANEQVFYARQLIDKCVCDIRKELKK